MFSQLLTVKTLHNVTGQNGSLCKYNISVLVQYFKKMFGTEKYFTRIFICVRIR